VSKTLNPEQYMSRRNLLLAGAVAATGLLAWSWTTNTRTQSASRGRTRATKAAKLPPEDLLKPGPMPDMSIGAPDAPVTIVEYASLTCPACANFHNKVLPVLKEKYIDTGKARLIFREFVFDERGALAAMVARCAGGEKSLPLVSALFSKQDEWAQTKTDFLPKLYGLAQQVGVTRQAFDQCRQDEKLLKNLLAQRERGVAFGVNATPTFFVNGKKLVSASIEDFDKAIAPVLNP
jgi:protein-disulfide isomerase